MKLRTHEITHDLMAIRNKEHLIGELARAKNREVRLFSMINSIIALTNEAKNQLELGNEDKFFDKLRFAGAATLALLEEE